nr:LysE family translocator [Acuticoccus kalidii]
MSDIGPVLPSLLLILSVFVVGAASPGPATLMIVNVAAGEGRKPAVILALGIVTGSIVWAIVAALGFVAALKTSAFVFTAMKIAGGGYLLYLAFKSIRSGLRGQHRLQRPAMAGTAPMRPARQFWRGLLLHLTNPKAPLVWMATLSVGTTPHASPALLFAAIALCATMAVLIFVGYALLFSTRRASAIYAALRRPLDVLVGTLFGLAGIKILTLKSV